MVQEDNTNTNNTKPYLTDEEYEQLEHERNEIAAREAIGNNNDECNRDPDTGNGNGRNGNGRKDNKKEKEKGRPVAEKLVDLISQNSNIFFKDQYDTTYARIHNSDHNEIIRVESGKFKRYLIRLYHESENKIANAEAVANAVQVLQARAEYNGNTYPLSVRVASYNNCFFYDLTNPKWECIKISEQGWELVDKTPIPLFIRYNQTPQVQPSHDYAPDIFDRFMNLTNVKNEDDKKLLKIYLISLFIPDIQHVILQTCGEKGGAKSMLEVLIKELVDPSKPKLLSIHKDRMEFIQQVAQTHVAFYDNLKYIPQWLSDEACRAVTGSGSSKRKLYTDDEAIVFEYMRCLGFNGINLVLTEPDALDRSIIIEQNRIDKKNRVPERLVIDRFNEIRPKLLGYIFSILVKAMKIKSTINLDEFPRMADFALWGEAIARAMGYKEMEFIRIYNNNTGKQNAEAIENNVLGQVLIRFLNGLPNIDINKGFCWEGTTSVLLDELNTIAINDKININAKGWPKAANSLTRRLKTILSNIREGLGFEISVSRDTTGVHKGVSSVRIWKIPSPSSPSSPDQNHAHSTSDAGEDIIGSEDMYPHQDSISSPENGQNCAQNGAGEGSEGSEDIFRNLSGVLSIPTPTPTPNLNPSISDIAKPYEHLIMMEEHPNLNRTAYYCKECPNVSPYWDLDGILESHFKPYHIIQRRENGLS
jgi:hypothetical protein